MQLYKTFGTHRNLLASWTNLDLPQTALDSLNWTKMQHRMKYHTQRIDAEVERARNSCWERGYNLDGIDQALEPNDFHGSKIGTSSIAEPSANTNNELVATMRVAAHYKRAKAWSTRQDRINAWLLQNLVASPDLAQLHRSFCKNGEDLSEEDWGRSVLEFWGMDEAAVRGEQESCSTNGAVDSRGACHSTRVLLEARVQREAMENG